MKLLTAIFILLFTINTFATTIYVSNKTSSEIVDQAYAIRPSYDSSWTGDLINTNIYPGEYDLFYTSTYNVYYKFQVATRSGRFCTVGPVYITASPKVIWLYDSGCIIQDYGR